MIKTGFKPPKPLNQGDVSGDCVLYSALNAVRYLWPEEFTDLDACEALYRELIAKWPGEKLRAMLVEGTESDDAYKVAIAIRHRLEKRGIRLGLSHIVGRDLTDAREAICAIRNKMAALPEPAVAIIGLDNPWNHWSVFTRLERDVLDTEWVHFYDSYAPERLMRLKVGAFTLHDTPERITLDARATVIYRRINQPVHA